MPFPQKKVPIEEVCRILEIPVSSWTLEGNMSREQAEKCIQDFKNLVKKQRKALAKKYHPDKTGGDDCKIKEINAMVDIVMKLEITKILQKPQAQKVRFHFTSNPYGSSSDSTGFREPFGGMRFYNFRTFR